MGTTAQTWLSESDGTSLSSGPWGPIHPVPKSTTPMAPAPRRLNTVRALEAIPTSPRGGAAAAGGPWAGVLAQPPDALLEAAAGAGGVRLQPAVDVRLHLRAPRLLAVPQVPLVHQRRPRPRAHVRQGECQKQKTQNLQKLPNSKSRKKFAKKASLCPPLLLLL